MKYLILLLVCVSEYAAAQIFVCPPLSTLVCAQTFTYDAAGNRKDRRSVCTCQILMPAPGNTPPTARLADTPPATTESVAAQADASAASIAITSIYPNPTNSDVRIKFSAPTEKATIQVSNSVGAILGTHIVSGAEADIPLGDYPAGIYLLTLLNASGISTHRVIKAD